jgi:hypothetical protein
LSNYIELNWIELNWIELNWIELKVNFIGKHAESKSVKNQTLFQLTKRESWWGR